MSAIPLLKLVRKINIWCAPDAATAHNVFQMLKQNTDTEHIRIGRNTVI